MSLVVGPSSSEMVACVDYMGFNRGPVQRSLVTAPEHTARYPVAGHLLVARPRLLGGAGVPASENEYALAVRSRTKTSWPLHLDFTASGMARDLESEIFATLRETEEELLFLPDSKRLLPLVSWKPCDGFWSRATVFVVHLAPDEVLPAPNPADIESLRWLTAREIRAATADTPMKPDLRQFIEKYGARLEF